VSHSQVSRWKAGSHQPGYAAMMRLGAELRKAHPGLGDLAPRLLRLAGYPAADGSDGRAPGLTDEERRVADAFESYLRDGASSEVR